MPMSSAGESARRVVVLHPGTLGDLLLSIPAIRAIRGRWASRSLYLVTREEAGVLLQACGEVDEAHSIESQPWASLWSPAADWPQELRSQLAACDAVVAWVSSSQEDLRRGLEGLGVADVRIGSPHGANLMQLHQRDRYGEAVGIGLPMQTLGGPVRVPERIRKEARDLLRRKGLFTNGPILAVHPGSGSRHKCLPPTQMGAVVRALANQGWQPLLISGPADHDLASQVRAQAGQPWPVVENQPLASIAGLLTHVACYVGHDSGVTHLAAALGTPTVALFGPTDPARWASGGDAVRVVRGPGCGCCDWTDVIACREKPCLSIPASEIVAACLYAFERSRDKPHSVPQGESSSCSVPRGYARVTS